MVPFYHFKRFQSTHPVRGGTVANGDGVLCVLISIHPPREGWDDYPKTYYFKTKISIHPPREGWDAMRTLKMAVNDISIHPPREGWDSAGRLITV